LRPTARSAATWLVVGAGYAIRSGTGIWLAGFGILSFTAIAGILYFAVFGIMFVLLTWVLEAASYCRTDGKDTLHPAPGLETKPHIAVLLRWTRWKVADGTGGQPGAAEPVLAKKGSKPQAPWNVALILGAGIGSIAGTSLTRLAPTPATYGPPVAVAVVGALALMVFTGFLARMAVTVTVAVALTGLTLAALRSPLAIVTAIPWIAIAGDYAFLCKSSYQDLMDFGPSLASALATAARRVPLLLLRMVTGRQTWQWAGFSYRPGKRASATGRKHS
jgi:hypothetical protein